MNIETIKVYSDYKSPYAYLAKDLVYDLERETGVRVDWLPYTLDIPAYLGSAKLDEKGGVAEQSDAAAGPLVERRTVVERPLVDVVRSGDEGTDERMPALVFRQGFVAVAARGP